MLHYNRKLFIIIFSLMIFREKKLRVRQMNVFSYSASRVMNQDIFYYVLFYIT